jgi:SAM-dependent methyltransferase
MNKSAPCVLGGGFSADWLALRETADHAARNRVVHAHFLTWVATRGEGIRVLDLGCGTGSTLRALAPQIARSRPQAVQHWTFVDLDEGLLERARLQTDIFVADSDLKRLQVDYRQADIADRGALETLIEEVGCDVITGSALIDLVSVEWLAALVEIAERRHLALFFTLNYSGSEEWLPPHPLDRAILAAFNADQRRDKGFGPALGGGAVACLTDLLSPLAFRVSIGASDWRLDAVDPLIAALAEGHAAAGVDSGGITEKEAAGWLESRRQAEKAVIGHSDIFAEPL